MILHCINGCEKAQFVEKEGKFFCIKCKGIAVTIPDLIAKIESLEAELAPLRKLNKFLPIEVKLTTCEKCGQQSVTPSGDCLDCGYNDRRY
jgi:hypothetical protein